VFPSFNPGHIGLSLALERFRHPFIRDLGGIRELANAVGRGTGLRLDSWRWRASGGTAAAANAAAPRKACAHL